MNPPSATSSMANGGGNGQGIDTIKSGLQQSAGACTLVLGGSVSALGKEKEAVINLLTSLQGVAWRQVEHQVEKLMEDAQGFDKTLELLDSAFRYDARVEMPRALEKFFYSISRKSEQTLLHYVSEVTVSRYRPTCRDGCYSGKVD